MTQLLRSLHQALGDFDIAVLDQWGVLHDGSHPYPFACDAMQMLHDAGKRIVVLSNSGKRAELNAARIERIGLPAHLISNVVTSGEAFWQDITQGRLEVQDATPRRLFPICDSADNALEWARGSDRIEITFDLVDQVDAILVMGLPDDTRVDAYDQAFAGAVQQKLPLICSNPDKTSPRHDRLVVAPGAIAQRYQDLGGHVIWYGKPYRPVYEAVLRCYPGVSPERFLMVGDSVEHDVAGASRMGFSTALIRGGIHSGIFAGCASEQAILQQCLQLCAQYNVEMPSFSLQSLGCADDQSN